ncbi:type VI secretion system membrane subunit TssM [Pseudomonas fontis]|uniref:Type VI secretion system membrane subunit TssM n=1 Tax=Pseudomonas fontis TaxID=2942633 RepID=A0ABT5P0C1_9PSED|nr:type VI secretion system membrane subunit TssM [Pseudomonas fontis]MDD0972928.1 type VI secretion system membrane subunit TssM [Pseudomonas fontis]MDD0993896.1 type VI secretion system membrane subunit TssM [Pseudomonas fontis]
MEKYWGHIKRWGLPGLSRAGRAMPLLLLLGALLLLVAIWWLGPQWNWRGQQPLAGLPHRILASLLALLLPLLFWVWGQRSRYRRLQAAQRQDAAIEADPSLPYVHAQEAALNQNLARFLDNAGGRGALYQLPWYLVLGTENVGKSSFITRSDQRFALTRVSKAQARGREDDGLAYPVDWWIGNDAVIVDPPGEFISQGAIQGVGQRGQHKERPELPAGTQARLWNYLLAWLSSHRSRRALNGVVLVVDLPALLHAEPEQRMALAHVLRARLHELSSQLGSRLPLYVVLSKFDLLEGFEQLFAQLPLSQRERIIGSVFNLDGVTSFDAWLEAFAEHYDRLLQAVQEEVLDHVGSITCAEQRQLLVSLPAQLFGLRAIILRFFSETLGSDRFTTPALVRGVYFSSVYQQGETHNTFVRAAAQPYKVHPPLGDAKPLGNPLVYFAQQVFERVVYPEAGLAGDNVKVAQGKRRLLWVGSGVGLLALAVGLGTWQRYFDANRDKAVAVLAKSQEFSRRDIDERVDPTGRNLLAPLEQIRDAVSVFGDYRSAWPLLADAGLYQGRAIGPSVDQAYLALLSRRFLPALAGGAVDAMNAAPDGSEAQMAALRVYRMIEDRDNRRPKMVEAWMARQWQATYPGQGQVQRQLMRHLQYALAYADTDLPQYRQRIAEVQQILRKVPLQQRIYQVLKQQARQQLHAGVDLGREVGPAFALVYQPPAEAVTVLAPLLTAKGFREYFEPNSEHITDLAMVDQWALGERAHLDYSDADRQALTERIRTLYSADYIDSWRRALNALAVVDFRDLAHGVSVLEQMTGPPAPLRRLLESVRDNTLIYPPAPEPLGKASEAVAIQTSNQQQATGIRRAFASLFELLDRKGEKPSYYDETLSALTAVYDYAKTVQDSPDRGKAALSAVLNRFAMTGPDPIGTLQRMASGLPEPVAQHVQHIAEQTSQVLVIEALRELEKRWDTEVFSFYQQRLAGRYPFNPQGVDASLDDFEAFFGPSGRLQQFQDQYLKVFLKDNLEALYSQSRGRYLVRTDLLDQLAAAERIRETFFDNRGNLSVQFSIAPLGLSANQRTSVLDLDGQLVPYTHGPSVVTGLIWPNTLAGPVRSNLTLVRLSGNSSLEFRGPWSMFRLLSRGTLNSRTATGVDLSFKAGDGMMRYQLTSEKALNPITQQPFKGFALPRTLLQASTGKVASAI